MGKDKSKKKATSGKLVKFLIMENGKPLMELLPTKSNEDKAMGMSHMAGITVIRVYEK